ncbi:MAG: Wzz/FepE/Etk N-terminal domain-containing protein [Armatimonadota bacterium]|nr:Wzz/FepE/Etk N-terminal domain-containing protein [Armatimonadota bacterium]
MEDREACASEVLDPGQLLAPILARWRLIVLCTVVGAVCGLVISLLLPRLYESRATIFPQQSQGITSLLSQLPIPINSRSTPAGYYTALLKSDTLLIRTLKSLQLLQNPQFTNGERLDLNRALRRLRKAVNIKENRDGSVSIVVRWTNPYLASQIANTMLDLLGGLVQTASKRKVVFISQKLKDTARDLREAEEQMKRFLEANDIAAIEDQSKAIIQELSELDGRLLAADVELREISSRLQNAGDLESLVEDEVRKKALEASRELIVKRKAELQKKLSLLPEVATEYGRLKRRVELLNQTYGVLTQQYQLERITQQGEGGDYQVIDRARPDKQKVAPRTVLNTALGGLIGLIAAAVGASLLASTDTRGRAQ